MADIKTKYVFEADASDLQKVADRLREIAKLEELYSSEAKKGQAELKASIIQTRLERQLAAEQARANAQQDKANNAGVNTELNNQLGILQRLKAELKTLKAERDRTNDTASIKEYNKQIEITSKEIANLTNQNNYFKGSFGFWRDMRNVVAGAFAVDAITGWIGKVFEAQSQTQLFELSMKKLFGEVKAGQLDKDLKNLISNSPLEFQQATKDITNLGFAYKSLGLGTKTLVSDYAALGNAARGNGELLSRLVYVYNQVAAAGKLTGNDVKQFTEAQVPILDLLSKTLGKTREQIQALQKDGKISFDNVRQAMLDASKAGGAFNGAMSLAMDTVSGKMSNLKDAVFFALSDIGDQYDGVAKKAIDFATKAVVSLVELIGKINPFRDALINGFSAIFDSLGSFMQLVTGSTNKVDAFAGVINYLGRGLALLALTIKTPIDLFVLLGKNVEIVGSQMGLFRENMKNLFGNNADGVKFMKDKQEQLIRDRDVFIAKTTEQNLKLKGIMYNELSTPPKSKKFPSQYEVDGIEEQRNATKPKGAASSNAAAKAAKKQEYEVEAQDEVLHQLRMQKIRLMMHEDEVKDKKEYSMAILELDFFINSRVAQNKYEAEKKKAELQKASNKTLKNIEDNYTKEKEALSTQNALDLHNIDVAAKKETLKLYEENNKKKWTFIVDAVKKHKSATIEELSSERKMSLDKVEILKNEAIERLNQRKEELQGKATSKTQLLQIEVDYNKKVRDIVLFTLSLKIRAINSEMAILKAKGLLNVEEEKKYKALVLGVEKEISVVKANYSKEEGKMSLKLKLAKIADAKEAMDFLIGTFAKSESAYIRGVGNMMSIYQKMKETIDKGGDSTSAKILAGLAMAASAASAFAEARLENIGREMRAEDARYNREINNINAKYDLENAKFDAIINRRKILEDELTQAILGHDLTKIASINAEILAYEAKEARKKELEAQFEQARKDNNVAEIERIGNELLKYTEAERNKLENDKLREAERAEAKKKHEIEIHELKIKQLKAQFSANVAQAIQQGAMAILSALSLPPPFGFIAAAAVGVVTAVQIGIAKRQRDSALAELDASRGYYEGTDRLPLGNNKKGRDTISINAHEGERIMPTKQNDELHRHFGRDVSNNELVKLATMKPLQRLEIMDTKSINEVIAKRVALEVAMNTKAIERGNKEIVEAIVNKATYQFSVDQTGFYMQERKKNMIINNKRQSFYGKA